MARPPRRGGAIRGNRSGVGPAKKTAAPAGPSGAGARAPGPVATAAKVGARAPPDAPAPQIRTPVVGPAPPQIVGVAPAITQGRAGGVLVGRAGVTRQRPRRKTALGPPPGGGRPPCAPASSRRAAPQAPAGVTRHRRPSPVQTREGALEMEGQTPRWCPSPDAPNPPGRSTMA